MAFWEFEDGDIIVHLEDLHETRLIDMSLGRPPRQFLSDQWDNENRGWIEHGDHLTGEE